MPRISVHIPHKAVTGALLFAFAFLALPGAAKAEGGLFGAIFHALGRAMAPPPAARNEPLQAPSSSTVDTFGRRTDVQSADGGPEVAYCVRTCDGRYFPMAKNSGSVTPAKMCQSMCPAANTEIYSGSSIENAVSHKGSKYTALANAFVYREKMVEGCSCNSASPVGNTNISYQNDPTLRPGDIVMTENGPVVFKGAVAATHKLSDFVPVQESNRISASMREKVIAMKVMPTRQAQAQIKRPEQRAKTAKEAATIVAETPDKRPQALGFAE